MCLRFTGKTIEKSVELSPSNGLEPATHDKNRIPISNRLRPKAMFELDRCVSGWSDIYDHSTNPVKPRLTKNYQNSKASSGATCSPLACFLLPKHPIGSTKIFPGGFPLKITKNPLYSLETKRRGIPADPLKKYPVKCPLLIKVPCLVPFVL